MLDWLVDGGDGMEARCIRTSLSGLGRSGMSGSASSTSPLLHPSVPTITTNSISIEHRMVESLRLALAPSSASFSNNVALQPLSQRLHRLWTERGDFSKFSLADLHDEDEVDEGDAKDQGEDTEGEEGRRIAIGWAPGEEEGTAVEQKDHEKEGDGAGSSSLETKPMSMEDFVALKEEMIGKLS